jgi:stage III sporulation protein AG
VQDLLRHIDPRRRRWLLAALLAGILLLAASSLWSGGPASPPSAPPASPPRAASSSSADPLLRFEADVDGELSQTLAEVRGAGRVTVAVTLAESPRLALAENLTVRVSSQQGGQAGGITTSRETDRQVVFSGQDRPVELAELGPQVVGVLVVAEGAGDPLVRADLTQAVETLLGVPAYKVLVLPREGAR